MVSEHTPSAPDLDLILHDFDQAFAEAPDRALAAVQLLLLQGDLCRARAAFLRRLGPGPAAPHDFAPEIDAIRALGTLDAVEQGKLSLERLVALVRHPGALWEAHLAATGTELPGPFPVSQPDDTRVRMGEMGTGLTSVFLHAPDEFRRRLRPWLPFLLEHVGLDAGRADAFLDFVLARAPELGTRRFRDLLPVWLREFAGGAREVPELSDEDFAAVADRGAVALVLDRATPDEPAWARDFRAFARGRALQSPQELRTLEMTGLAGDEYDLRAFRRGLAAEAEQLREAELSFLLN
jgi:hypothetical protein